MKTCKDCGVEIHELANHTGNEKWCEDCFDKGFHKDTDDHFRHTVKTELMDLNTIKEVKLSNANKEFMRRMAGKGGFRKLKR